MTDFILPRLPKSLQYYYIEFGRNVGLALIGALAAIVFIVLFERGSDTIQGHALLAVTNVTQQVGNNGSAETVFTVTTPDGTSATILTQSPAVIRDTGATLCAEQLRAADGTLRWEASITSACQ